MVGSDMNVPVTPQRQSGLTAHVGALVACAATLLAGIVSWVNVGNLPLDARIALALATGLLALLTVTLIFNDAARFRTGKKRRRFAIVAGLAVAAFTSLLLWLAVDYHSLIFTDEDYCHASRPGWRCVGVSAPHHSVTIDWRFRLDPRTSSRVEWWPGYWTDDVGAPSTRFDDQTLTVSLKNFVYPQRYGVAFRTDRVGGRVEELLQQVEPNTTTRLHTREYRRLIVSFAIGGLAIWALASSWLYSSGRWLQRFRPLASSPTAGP
jgi:hypothetical protein